MPSEHDAALAEIEKLANKVGEQSHPQARRVHAEMLALLAAYRERCRQVAELCEEVHCGVPGWVRERADFLDAQALAKLKGEA